MSLTRQYNKLIKCLLGVRNNTSTNLCHIESGIRPITHVLSVRRKRFLESKVASPDMEEPFLIVLALCRNANTPGFKFIQNAMQYNCDVNPLVNIINLVSNKPEEATKYNTYKTVLHPSLNVHKIYSSDNYIPDFIRKEFTRLRLMSHDLKIETGRWSRVPRDLRRCICNGRSVKTEYHVSIGCILTRELRRKFDMYNIQNLNDLFMESNNVNTVCRYVYEVLNIYRNL